MATNNTTGSTPAAEVDGVSVPNGVGPKDVSAMTEVPSQIQDRLKNAPAWETYDGLKEQNVFDQMYGEAALAYYANATDVPARGRQVLRVFLKWQPSLDAFVRSVLHNSGIPNDLNANLTWNPSGSSEAIVRPLLDWSFSNAQYEFTPSSTGDYQYIPNTTSSATETATDDEQAYAVIGYVDYATGEMVPYDYIQEEVDDTIGVRRPFPLKNQMEGIDTLKVADRDRGPLYVYPGNTLNLDLNVVKAGIKSRLYPLGIEVVTQNASNYGGILD